MSQSVDREGTLSPEAVRHLVLDLFIEDQRTNGHPALKEQDVVLARRWLERLLIDHAILQAHTDVLGKLYRGKARRTGLRQDGFDEQRALAVAEQGVAVLAEEEVARLLLDPAALWALADLIDDRLPDAWVGPMAQHGMALGEEAAREKQEGASDEADAWEHLLPDSWLDCMDRIGRELAEHERPRAVIRRSARWAVFTHAIAAAAASVLVALVSWLLLRPVPPQGPELVALAAAPVVEWRFLPIPLPDRTEAPRGVVFSRQPFKHQIRATARRYGWLYQIDSLNAYLLDRLVKQPDGSLTADNKGTFDDNSGYEYFLIVLSDSDVPALDAGNGPATWLTASEKEQLQKLGKEKESENRAVQVIQQALSRHGWTGTAKDLRIKRLEHRHH